MKSYFDNYLIIFSCNCMILLIFNFNTFLNKIVYFFVRCTTCCQHDHRIRTLIAKFIKREEETRDQGGFAIFVLKENLVYLCLYLLVFCKYRLFHRLMILKNKLSWKRRTRTWTLNLDFHVDGNDSPLHENFAKISENCSCACIF